MGRLNLFSRYESLFKIGTILAVCLYLFMIQFTTSYGYIHLLPIPTPAVLTFGVSMLFVFYWFLFSKDSEQIAPTTLNLRYVTILTMAFSISIIVAVLSALYTMNTIFSAEYMEYLKGSMIKRILYYSAYILLLYFGYKTISKMKTNHILMITNVYPLSLLLLVMVGLWQLLYFFYNIPFLDLETRSYVHSVTGNSFFNFRLTSFADEPSYLGPVLIDMIILGYLSFKRKWIYIALIVLPAIGILLFSFSVSAYFNLLLIAGFIVMYLIFHPKFPKKYLIIILGVGILAVGVLFLVKPGIFMTFFSPILGRVDQLFDPQSSSRIYMYIMPIYWLFDHSILSALFGYGPGSYDFLHATKILPNKVSIATSSNNMYIDLLFEHGIIGLIIVLAGLVYIFIYLWKKGRSNAYYFIALLEFVHILITALYRADFVTPRFWAVLLIIFLLARVGEAVEENKSLKGGHGIEN